MNEKVRELRSEIKKHQRVLNCLKNSTRRVNRYGLTWIILWTILNGLKKDNTAVNYYGYTRSTLDIDFMCIASDVVTIRALMVAEGFSNVSEHENVIFFQKPNGSLRVDFLKVDQQTLDTLLSRAVTARFNDLELKLPELTDLIAMKLFALHNGASRRREKDLPDIVNLMIENNLDEQELRPLCMKYANETIYQEIVTHIQEHKTC
jgi:hypothetical protein